MLICQTKKCKLDHWVALTAFSAYIEVLKYYVLSFGLISAPLTVVCLMPRVLGDLADVIVYNVILVGLTSAPLTVVCLMS